MRNINKKNKPKHTTKGCYRIIAMYLNEYDEDVVVYEFKHNNTIRKSIIVDDVVVLYKNNNYILKGE